MTFEKCSFPFPKVIIKNLEDLISKCRLQLYLILTLIQLLITAAVNVTLSDDEIQYFEELYRPTPILGHIFNWIASLVTLRFVVPTIGAVTPV